MPLACDHTWRFVSVGLDLAGLTVLFDDHKDLAAWKVATGSFIALIVSGPPLIVYTQSQFIQPVTQELGWSRAEFFLPLSIAGMLSAVFMSLIGRVADRFPIRAILLPCIVLFSLAYMGLAFVGSALWVYGLLLFACIIFQIPHGGLYYAKVISLWPSRRPALLLGVALAGNAAGGIILPPIAGWLISDYGWRAARFCLGAGALLAGFSAAYLLVKPPPDQTVRHVGAVYGRTMREGLRDRNYWILILALSLGGLVLNGMMGHVVPFLMQRGFSRSVGIAGISVVSGTALAARFVSGFTLDRIDSPRAAIPFLLAGFLGMVMLITVSSTVLIVLALVLLGTSMGAEIEFSAYFVRRYFGTRSYGELYGLILAVFTIGTTTGPLLLGEAYDLSGSYRIGAVTGACLMLTAATALLFLQPYRYGVRSERSAPAHLDAPAAEQSIGTPP